MLKHNVLRQGVMSLMLSSVILLVNPVVAHATTTNPSEYLNDTAKTSFEINEISKTFSKDVHDKNIHIINPAFGKAITTIVKDAQKKTFAKEENAKLATPAFTYTGPVLTPAKGVVYGPSGKETYYNLPMAGVISIMRGLGYSEAEYPYHVREDGVKMLGPYIMVAANLNIRPRGTIYQTSLGNALVCDTGEFAKDNPMQTDIAVSW